MPSCATFEVDYIVGLGANLGSRQASMAAALELLAARAQCALTSVSALYQSEPVGPPQPRYLNAAARVRSELSPHALLDLLQQIESTLGRQRRERWGARTIDLDLLWAPEPVASEDLQVPHPRLRERWFALGPLLQVAPELEPEYGPSLRALRTSSTELQAGVLARPVAEAGWHEGSRATARQSPDSLELSCVGTDRADALAELLTSLGQRLWPERPCATSAAQVLLGRCTQGDEPAELVRQALAAAAEGFAFSRATLCDLGPQGFEARLIGQPLDRAPQSLALITIEEYALPEGHLLNVYLARASVGRGPT
jgi:2-amino-4-hydroxy-6-hydroxymethyldihydropteridine diphosphokinase